MKLWYIFGTLCVLTTAAGADCDIVPEPMVRYTDRFYTAPRSLKTDIFIRLDSILLSALEKPVVSHRAINTASKVVNPQQIEIFGNCPDRGEAPSTPEEMQCAAREYCGFKHTSNPADKHKTAIRNPDVYCECVSKAAREQSYQYEILNEETYNTILSQKFPQCDYLFDRVYNMRQVYTMIYRACLGETHNPKECDKFAVDVRASVVRMLAEIRPKAKHELYGSEYNKIVNHQDFLEMLAEINSHTDSDTNN